MDASKTVSFTQMKDGTREDYAMLQDYEHAYVAGTADRLLAELKRQGEETLEGYKITRLDHALQAATRAEREGADIDWIVSALLHDIGDGLAPTNHDKFAAAILKPYVREECAWVVEHHGTFQMVYYMHHYGGDPNQREQFKDHPSYQACVDFCERWDQSSFDPDYNQHDLAHFEPMVRKVFSRPPHDKSVKKAGEALGLPKETLNNPNLRPPGIFWHVFALLLGGRCVGLRSLTCILVYLLDFRRTAPVAYPAPCRDLPVLRG